MNKLFLRLHRVLGSVLSLFFLMWFLSGFVMLFHTFPSISQEERYRGLEAMQVPQDSTSSKWIDSVFLNIPKDSLRSISLRAGNGGAIQMRVQRGDSIYRYQPNACHEFGVAEVRAYAQRLLNAPILRIDTITSVDTWVPYPRGKKPFPLYKVYYADKDNTELYVSPDLEEGVQMTTSDSRFWSYLGAIPHWIYFYQLRQHRDAWVWLIMFVSGLGFVMCVAGIFVGFRSYKQYYNAGRGWRSPYKKWAYRLHHQFGFFFGLLVCGFIFSGFMSVTEVPQQLLPSSRSIERSLREQSVFYDPDNWKSIYRKAFENYGKDHIKQIDFLSIGSIPYARIITDKEWHYVILCFYLDYDAESNLSPLYLEEHEVKYIFNELSGGSKISINLLNEYDTYYISRHENLPLPVYRIDIDNAEGSTIYLNPKTAEVKYYDDNTKLRQMLYTNLHSYIIKPLVERPLLWWTVIIISLLFGTLVSVTGVVLSYKWIRRKKIF